MLFNSIEFLTFFPIVTLMYFVIPGKLRTVWLLAASYFFYTSWNPRYAVLIVISTVITFICGLLTERMKGRQGRKLVVIFSLVINLAILGVFKYADFLLQTLDRIMSFCGLGGGVRQKTGLASSGRDILLHVPDIKLYLGCISGKYQGRKKYYKVCSVCFVFPAVSGWTD